MTTEVTTCSPSTPFMEIVGKLLDDDVSGVPVVTARPDARARQRTSA